MFAFELGEFNEVIELFEKFGERNINFSRSSIFRNYVNDCKLINLGFKGSRFTYTIKRKEGLVMERLDRFFTNDEWLHLHT